jgi:N-hydroxyarylamine O-acetyltransferase
MTTQFDLNAYLARIGYDGPRTATLETLHAVHRLHPAAIPFENLNPLLGLPVLLDAESLQDKMVHSGRGGYCFEHNGLLRGALEALGFKVTGLAARVVWGRAEDAITQRTHMALLVELDAGQYLVDVGFGGQTLTGPIPFRVGEEHSTPHEPFRLIERKGEYLLHSKVKDEWRALYRFDLQPQFIEDYQLANWYVATHPESPFVRTLRIARSVPGRRYGLLNDDLSIHTLDEESVSRKLSSLGDLKEALVEIFGIKLPEHPGLDARLTAFITPTLATVQSNR